MRDELLTRHAVEQLELDSVADGYFDRVLAAAHASERRALRRARRAVAACGVLALIGVGSATAMLVTSQRTGANVVEGTLSCATQLRAGDQTMRVWTQVTLPARGSSPGGPGSVAILTVDKMIARQIVPALAVGAASTEVSIDRSVCRRARGNVPLSAAGLPSNGVLTPSFLGGLRQICKVPTPRVLMRYRVVIGRAGATHAQVAIRADNRRMTPIAFLDWRPTRIATFLSARCS